MRLAENLDETSWAESDCRQQQLGYCSGSVLAHCVHPNDLWFNCREARIRTLAVSNIDVPRLPWAKMALWRQANPGLSSDNPDTRKFGARYGELQGVLDQEIRGLPASNSLWGQAHCVQQRWRMPALGQERLLVGRDVPRDRTAKHCCSPFCRRRTRSGTWRRPRRPGGCS